MAPSAHAVSDHYSQPGLASRLLNALRAAGKNPDALVRDDLAGFDEFHTRGREATRELVAMAHLHPGMEVLDVGCGIGGPARTLAAECGCHVTGLDLVDEFCRAADELTDRVGLAEQVKFRQGDALEMPFESGSFDAALLEHVTMNIDDKPRLFEQLRRVLRPRGHLLLYEVCAGERAPVHFPVPWAREPEISFLASPAELRMIVEAAGFVPQQWRDVSQRSIAWFSTMVQTMAQRPPDAPPPLGLNLLMGPDTPQKIGNVIRNLEEDRTRIIQAHFTRSPAEIH